MITDRDRRGELTNNGSEGKVSAMDIGPDKMLAVIACLSEISDELYSEDFPGLADQVAKVAYLLSDMTWPS